MTQITYRRGIREVSPRSDGPGAWGLLGTWEVGPLRALGIERVPSAGDASRIRPIPAGRHRVVLDRMASSGWLCLRLVDWPETDSPGERDHFVLHPGSWPENYWGCVGAGTSEIWEAGALVGVGGTRDACAALVGWVAERGDPEIFLVVEGAAPT